jgi:hypothetical protein
MASQTERGGASWAKLTTTLLAPAFTPRANFAGQPHPPMRTRGRRNPRDRDPKRWSRTAWRRYLYTAAHAPSLLDLERIFEQ